MAQPIAYVDETGYVTLVAPNTRLSEYIVSKLKPLYTQAEIDAAMAAFYEAQGVAADGSLLTPVAPDLATSAAEVSARAADRQRQGKAQTGVSIAEAAAAALNIASKK